MGFTGQPRQKFLNKFDLKYNMSKKSRGTDAERDLIRKFWSEGWPAMRAAGSGSMQYPSPDILTGKNGRRLAIECKLTSSKKKYFPISEINELNYFAKHFGAEVWLAIKFPKHQWVFFTPEDLESTGKSFAASLELAELKGLSFEELIDL